MKVSFSFILILFVLTTSLSAISNKRYELLSGVKKVKDKQSFWNKTYSRKKYIYGKAPADFLAKNFHYLPYGGKILDMGMGEGRNTVFLAQQKYDAFGIDISKIAIKKAHLLAKERKVKIKTVVASLNKYKIAENSLDGIIVFYYIDRSLNENIYKWLKPGGILIFEAYNKRQKKVRGFENQKDDFLLKEGELLTMFPRMRILKYAEPLHLKKFTSSIILQK